MRYLIICPPACTKVIVALHWEASAIHSQYLHRTNHTPLRVLCKASHSWTHACRLAACQKKAKYCCLSQSQLTKSTECWNSDGFTAWTVNTSGSWPCWLNMFEVSCNFGCQILLAIWASNFLYARLSWDTWGNQVPGSNKHLTIVLSTSWHFHRTPRNLCQMDPNGTVSESAKSDQILDAHSENMWKYSGCFAVKSFASVGYPSNKKPAVMKLQLQYDRTWWNYIYVFQEHVQKRFSWLLDPPCLLLKAEKKLHNAAESESKCDWGTYNGPCSQQYTSGAKWSKGL